MSVSKFQEANMDIAISNVDLRSLVKLALSQKVSWSGLRISLQELTSTFEISKELNVVLLEELQILHSKTRETQIQDRTHDSKKHDIDEISCHDEVTVLFSNQETFDKEVSFFEDNKKVQDFLVNEYLIDENNVEGNQFDKVVEDNRGTNSLSVNDSLKEQERMDETIDQKVIDNNSSIWKGMESKENVKNRRLFINGERKYSCKTCGLVCKQSSNLKKHERIHTGERPHGCETCSKRFPSKSALIQHCRNHSEQKTFECKTCKQYFRHSSGLWQHRKRKHKLLLREGGK